MYRKSNEISQNFVSQGDWRQEINRLLKLIRKRKLIVILFSCIAFFIWMIITILFIASPTYTSTAILTFQDPSSMSPVVIKDGRRGNEGKISLIKTNVLLGQVAEKLQLNLKIITKNVKKNDIFKYIFIDKNAIPGYYYIKNSGENFSLFFEDVKRGVPKYNLLTFSKFDTISVNKFKFIVNQKYFKKNEKKRVEFQVMEFQEAIDLLRNRVKYETDRYQSVLKISATSKDPEKAAKIVNTLADLFIDLNLKMKLRKSNEIIKILEGQLKIVKLDLIQSNERLKKFRESYPWVVLTGDADLQIINITQLEENKNRLQLKINDFKNMLLKIQRITDFSEKLGLLRELITYLNNEGLPLAPAFEKELTDLITKRNQLLNQNFSIEHPYVKENEENFNKLIYKVRTTSNNYIQQIQRQIKQIDQKINNERYKIRRLPQKELELAELLRDQKVKNELYLKILSRYNEAKIENEVEVGDVFIVDYGTPPLPENSLLKLILKALFGLLFSMGIGIGVAVIIDIFDKKVIDIEELQRRAQLPILGSIPTILNQENNHHSLNLEKGKRNPKLITLDYSPSVESESYRELRTKILFMSENKSLSSFLITSLQPEEGKSLTASNLAITIAQQKIPTVLIDADLRRGVLHNDFGNKKKPGLSDFLIAKSVININSINKILQKTFVPNLFLISSGSFIPNPAEMLGSQKMIELMQYLKAHFGMAILDTAPFQVCSDSAVLSNLVEGAILIVRASYTNVDSLERKIKEYPNIEKKLIGIVLNMVRKNNNNKYLYSYYNY